jgi:hypothetical protein
MNARDHTMSATEAKARLYKTAEFSAPMRNLEPHLTTEPVRVVFMSLQRNEPFKCDEPVYAVFGDMTDESFIGTYFERALTRFVL